MNNKGITLIALVITIIVMLILATVTINFVIGENGTINRAKEAKIAIIDDIENDKTSIENLEYDIDTHLMEPLERISLDELQDDTLNEELQKLIITVNITDDNKTIRLPTYNYADVSSYYCNVDWGDGTERIEVNESNFNTVTHTYINTGKYDIKISGTFKSIYIHGWDSDYSGISNALKKIKQWGTTSLTNIELQKCENLSEIATPTRNSFNELEVVQFPSCTGLIIIPEKLFINCPNVISFDETFNFCTGITSIPERLFANCPRVIRFGDTFSDCTGITSIPENLFANCSNVENFICTFLNCSNLTGQSIHLWSEGREGITETSGGNGCYAGCVNLDDYEEIPIYWKWIPKEERI